ncbi:MAG: VCBS repeat-containing protein [Clostridia bacterium]|nr:VCBS repeat-containing protein [Clostridia bacterium]
MRRLLKKISAVLVLLGVILTASGCAELTGLDAQGLMQPPKTTADREAIYALMRDGQPDVKLVYPKNGEYRSAVVSKDLDKDGALDVVTFCVNSEAGGIRLEFFSREANGDWYSRAEFISMANQVDRVFFGDVTGDGQEEIVIGWGDPLTATASISVYCLKNRGAEEIQMSAQPYSDMLLTDFEGDGISELFVLDVAGQPEEDGTVAAPLGRLFRFNGEQAYVAQTVPLDAAVTRYTSAVFMPVNSWYRAAVIDGIKADGRMVTQVVSYDENTQMLQAPLSEVTVESPNPTDRTAVLAVNARDINNDSVVEIPTAELRVRKSNAAVDSTGYCVTWNTYSPEDRQFTPVCSSIVNAAENYYLILPSGAGNFACANDTVMRRATFFRYEFKGYDDLLVGQQDLCSITVYSEDGWERTGIQEEDIMLGSLAGRVYALSVLDPALTPESELIRRIVEGFKILNE